MSDPPVPGPREMREPLTGSRVERFRIIVDQFHCEATIGVTEAERAQPQRLEVSAELILRSTPPQNDDIAETVNYGAVVRILRHLCRSSEYHLLETLAEAIAGAFFVYEEVIATRIQILKPDRYPDLKGIGIEIERRRDIG